MRWFSRKKQALPTGKGTGWEPSGADQYRIPSDRELDEKSRAIEEVNRQLDEDPGFQAILREFGVTPAERPAERPTGQPGPSMETVMEHVRAGGLSYIASPPADYPEVAPEAHELWLGEALFASMMGDDARCLSVFEQVLEITRHIGQKTGEATVLYNIGVAHYKLGDLDMAIEVLLEGKSLARGLAGELAKEARKAQRFEEEQKTDHPSIDVFGTPRMEQQLLGMYLEALATVYDADSRPEMATGCRDELKRLQSRSA
jgi:tetratricopeptide (TPR) repeat protein